MIENVLSSGNTVYGVNTGFGSFANTVVSPKDLCQLQLNLIRSHAVGQGAPLAVERVRMLLALRINVIAKGRSGVSRQTVDRMVAAFNCDCMPLVPEKGSVGASGDLAPLAHLCLGLIGEGEIWDNEEKKWSPALNVLNKHHLQPIQLTAKEGLGLINGTQFITSLACEAYVRGKRMIDQADIIGALTFEALGGHPEAFDARIHEERPHPGQIEVARRLRCLVHSENNPSEIPRSSSIQDAYTLRCLPQVHGIVHDNLKHVHSILSVELNSSTDNPLVFPPNCFLSGGNFHGEYPAKAADLIAMSLADLGNISERRTERLVNSKLGGFPSFLVPHQLAGLNSGFMIIQYTAAALASENKALSHPASVDTIPTSEGQEDHVSMGAYAARKALQVVENVESIVAIELLVACQALDLKRPAHSTRCLEEIYTLVRSVVPKWEYDRYMKPDMDSVVQLLRQGKVWEIASKYLEM